MKLKIDKFDIAIFVIFFCIILAILSYNYKPFADFRCSMNVPPLALRDAIDYCAERNTTFDHWKAQLSGCAWVCSEGVKNGQVHQ